jgi:hypothetical protein
MGLTALLFKDPIIVLHWRVVLDHPVYDKLHTSLSYNTISYTSSFATEAMHKNEIDK